jgi:TPR repeat protein
MNMLAMIYEQGMGVEVDDETAKSWRMHAAMAKANRERKGAR